MESKIKYCDHSVIASSASIGLILCSLLLWVVAYKDSVIRLDEEFMVHDPVSVLHSLMPFVTFFYSLGTNLSRRRRLTALENQDDGVSGSHYRPFNFVHYAPSGTSSEKWCFKITSVFSHENLIRTLMQT